MSDAKIPRECPRCGCDSVCCTCGYIDELRGVIEQEEDYEPLEPDGECYRGGEAAGALAESQAWIQRNLK